MEQWKLNKLNALGEQLEMAYMEQDEKEIRSLQEQIAEWENELKTDQSLTQ